MNRKLISGFLMCLITLTGAFGFVDPAASDIPEMFRVRAAMEGVMVSPIRSAQALRPTTRTDPETGDRVRVEVVEQDEALYFLFVREQSDGFPIDRAGNWIIKRSVDTGEFLQAKIFLHDSPGTFARIFPKPMGATMDLYLEGNILHRSVSLRMEFERILVEPLSRIIDLTRYFVDWNLFSRVDERSGDRLVEAAADEARAQLGSLSDSDDGAMDADGSFLFIEDLTENLESGFNCSGFAKWMVDGVQFPLTGSYLKIAEIKQKHVELRGHEWSLPLEDERDPYFGLDWTRNLAVSVYQALGRDVVNAESADVRYVRFFEYTEDVGYRVDDLRTILYLLSKDRPGSIYLGSVNQAFGVDPVLRQHTHVVVLLPYFDATGKFRIDVMERNLETSLESLGHRYGNDFIHLVEIPVTGTFMPPTFVPSP